MSGLIYAARLFILFLATWLGIRIIGKKSITQMTSYDLAGVLLMSAIAAGPLVYKITTKATEGVLIIAMLTYIIGKLSLNKRFYNTDLNPSMVIIKGKVIKDELKRNNINLPFLLSELRTLGYPKVADIDYAIIEPNGNISVIPKTQARNVKVSDLNTTPKYEGLTLPLIIDGEIQYKNLKYVQKDINWLNNELNKKGINNSNEVFLAEFDAQNNLYVLLNSETVIDENNKPNLF